MHWRNIIILWFFEFHVSQPSNKPRRKKKTPRFSKKVKRCLLLTTSILYATKWKVVSLSRVFLVVEFFCLHVILIAPSPSQKNSKNHDQLRYSSKLQLCPASSIHISTFSYKWACFRTTEITFFIWVFRPNSSALSYLHKCLHTTTN